MSATVTKVPNGEDVWGKHKVQLADIVGDTSYPTGGYTISPAKVGMKTIRGAKVIGGNAAAGKILAAWDSVNGKLILSYPTGGATAPATVTAPVGGAAGAITVTNGAITAGAITVAAGATPVTSTGANGAGIASAANPTQATTTATQAAGGALVAGIGKEVGNTTDVSSITVRLIFIGE